MRYYLELVMDRLRCPSGLLRGYFGVLAGLNGYSSVIVSYFVVAAQFETSCPEILYHPPRHIHLSRRNVFASLDKIWQYCLYDKDTEAENFSRKLTGDSSHQSFDRQGSRRSSPVASRQGGVPQAAIPCNRARTCEYALIPPASAVHISRFFSPAPSAACRAPLLEHCSLGPANSAGQLKGGWRR
jgi:hypothetical protein